MAAKKKEKEEEIQDVRGPELPKPQYFEMVRNADESGVSGTGRVLCGTVYPNGKCTVTWVAGNVQSVTAYDSFEDFKAIHISSHPDNKTELQWYVMRKKST